MIRPRNISRIGLLSLACSVLVVSTLFAASWDAFTSASFSGIGLDKPLQANVLDYTLMLGSAPTVTIGSKTYGVNWVQAVYVVSGTPTGTFVATDGAGPNGWSWDSKTKPAQIAGWTGQGSDRLYAGQSADISFASFDPGGNPVVPAFHISYQDGGKAVTDWFKSNNATIGTVPEPSSIICLSVGVCGLLFVARQRKRARRL